MKLVLERYVFKEVAIPFALAMFVMTILMLIQRMIQITEWVVNRGVPIIHVFQLLALMLPFFLTIVTPVALLLATLLAMNRLSADSEIIVMKATGIPVMRLFTPVLLLGVLCTAATAFLSLYAIPHAADWTNKLKENLAHTGAMAMVRVKGFVSLGSGLKIYVDAVEGDTLKGVMLARTGSKKSKSLEGPEMLVVLAKEGRITSEPDLLVNNLQLTDGEIQTSDRDDGIFRLIKFNRFDIKIDVGSKDKKNPLKRGTQLELMGLGELGREKERYTRLIRKIESTMPMTKTAEIAVERYRVALRQIEISKHEKFSLPFACLILALWGIPLGMQPPRTTRHQGVVMSILLTLIYYALVSGGKVLAVKGVIPPFWALWGPDIVVVLSGLYFLYRVSNDRPVGLPGAVARVSKEVRAMAEKFRRES